MGRHWPLQDCLELGALPGAVASARLHAQHILWEWGKTDLTEPVLQVVSELVTNAITATRATRSIQPVRIWLLSDTRTLLVLVWDASPGRPQVTEAADDAEHGRGLLIVQAYSDRWGTYPTPQIGGKVVWAQWD